MWGASPRARHRPVKGRSRSLHANLACQTAAVCAMVVGAPCRASNWTARFCSFCSNLFKTVQDPWTTCLELSQDWCLHKPGKVLVYTCYKLYTCNVHDVLSDMYVVPHATWRLHLLQHLHAEGLHMDLGAHRAQRPLLLRELLEPGLERINNLDSTYIIFKKKGGLST